MKLGFQFVPFPREIWTENIELSQAEFRLLGWLCASLRFGVSQLKVADHQVLNGFQDHRGYIHPPAGLSKNSLRRAREALVEKNLIVCERLHEGGGRGNTAGWEYSLNLSDSDQFNGNPPNFDPKPSQLGPETLPTLTLNPPNLDPVIRKERSTEEAEKTLTSSLRSEDGESETGKNPKKEKPNPRSKPNPPDPDARHAPVREFVKTCWLYANKGAPTAPWSAPEAKLLAQVLQANASWTVDDFKRCIRNRFRSDVNNAEQPRRWLPDMASYFTGSLDRYGKPKGCTSAGPPPSADPEKSIGQILREQLGKS